MPIPLLAAVVSPRLVFLVIFASVAAAQAPVNDVISWPSGLMLLATVLYAALGNTPAHLWAVEPASGICIAGGLPIVALPSMQRWRWHADRTHFVPRLRRAQGWCNFWIPSDKISPQGRQIALEKAKALLPCVQYSPVTDSEPDIDASRWTVNPGNGLLRSTRSAPTTHLMSTEKSSSFSLAEPTARDYLLFAAAGYHLIPEFHVDVHVANKCVYSNAGRPRAALVDVDGEEAALYAVAVNMVIRPHSQSPLRGLAIRVSEDKVVLHLDRIDLDAPACTIDFHSYSPVSSKVSASLREMARSYYAVVRSLEQTCPSGHYTSFYVGGALWTAILGGACLDTGRLTIQGLPGRREAAGRSVDEIFIDRVEGVLEALAPVSSPSAFDETVFSGGQSRGMAMPFLIMGLVGQALICYFLAVGTTAGVWTSVALANSLFNGRLVDLHSLHCGKGANLRSDQPGMKMYVPGTKTDLMCIATFDRSPPAHAALRPGVLLNILGLVAAALGAVFQSATRDALGFSEFRTSPIWVSYTAVGLSLGTSLLIIGTIIWQQFFERRWFDDSEIGQRWTVYCSVVPSFVVSGLAVFFLEKGLSKFWPILDAVTFVSGFPLGILENGWLFPADDNLVHLALLNRWAMGAVASSLGSYRPAK